MGCKEQEEDVATAGENVVEGVEREDEVLGNNSLRMKSMGIEELIDDPVWEGATSEVIPAVYPEGGARYCGWGDGA